eukprot:11356663-Alexandrium_andersonii.AAC.1
MQGRARDLFFQSGVHGQGTRNSKTACNLFAILAKLPPLGLPLLSQANPPTEQLGTFFRKATRC